MAKTDSQGRYSLPVDPLRTDVDSVVVSIKNFKIIEPDRPMPDTLYYDFFSSDQVKFDRTELDNLDFLTEVNFSIEKNRLVVSPELLLFSAVNSRQVNTVTSLRSIKSFKNLPFQIKAIVNTIINLTKSNDFIELKRLFFSDDVLSRVLNLSLIRENLNLVETDIPREKKLAVKVLEDLKWGIQKSINQELKKSLNNEEYQEVTKMFKNLK